jgi:hypothetical protein
MFMKCLVFSAFFAGAHRADRQLEAPGKWVSIPRLSNCMAWKADKFY